MKRIENYIVLLISLVLVQCSSLKKKEVVDSIFFNYKIYTINSSFEITEAVAVKDGKILDVGSSKDILEKYQSENHVDGHGNSMYPGFNDAHCHFTGFALDAWKCELWGTKSWDEILQRLKEYEKIAPTEWIYGRSWDQNDWDVKEFPTKEKLDELFPNRPVFLKRIDGHAAVANQKALDIAVITIETKINGGEIEIKNGKLTGILIDHAMSLVEQKIPEISEKLAIDYITKMQQECFSLGLTSVQDCGITEKMFELLQETQNENRLKIKVFALLSDEPDTYDRWISKGRFTDGVITFGGYKVYADGALGSRGACLLHDYQDKSGWKGFLLSDKNHFESLAKRLKNSNLQMVTHAIGDSANRVILQLYGNILGENNDRRWRIEHAQVISQNDFELFGKYSVIPSVQPTHATSDMYWAESRLGKSRLKNSYAYKMLLEQNGWLPLGTDFPVEEINPIKTFYAAVVRKDAENFPENGFQKENALTREQAIRGMTIWAAKVSFEEHEKGSIEKGKAADFVVLNQDIMTVPESEILNTKILETWSNGQNVYNTH